MIRHRSIGLAVAMRGVGDVVARLNNLMLADAAAERIPMKQMMRVVSGVPEYAANSSRGRLVGIAAVAALMSFGATAQAQDAAVASGQSWQIAAKAGVLMGGEMTVNGDNDFDTEAGTAVVLHLEAAVAPKLTIGGFIFGASTEAFDEEISIATVGVTIKGRFTLGNGMQLRPGLHLGYQTMSGDSGDSTTGFEVGGLLELAIPTSGRHEWLIEGGFITQPVGGNSEIDLVFGPIGYIAAGIGFGG